MRYEIILHENHYELLTLEGLAQAAQVHPELIRRFVDYGLIVPVTRTAEEMFFGVEAVPRLRAIERLRREVGIGLPGVAVILDLTDKIRSLQREVEWLRNR